MKSLRPCERLEDDRIAGQVGEWDGAFIIRCGSAELRVISSNGGNWDHVSVSLPTRCPTWEEMCFVKRLFFGDELPAFQLHPPQSEWVNNHRFCLHLWRPQDRDFPTPPAIYVGIKSLGVIA